MSEQYDEQDVEEWQIRSEEDEEREDFGCTFPQKCVMPGLHYPSECYTAEMYEQMVAELEE